MDPRNTKPPGSKPRLGEATNWYIQVAGRLKPGATPGQVIAAVFPGGTITGCPKVRAMEIIAELEGVGRGAYTGAMGYLSRCGRLDTNILIRTVVVSGLAVSTVALSLAVTDEVAPWLVDVIAGDAARDGGGGGRPFLFWGGGCIVHVPGTGRGVSTGRGGVEP